jgi:reductive dehalogenase
MQLNTELSNDRVTDQEAGFDIGDDFERFSQKDDMFNRAWWDESVRNEKTELFFKTYRRPLVTWRKAEGFTQKDYALRNASWHVADIFAEMKGDEDRREGFLDEYTLQREGPDEHLEMGSPTEAAAEIKRVARAFGADLVGITHLDERWLYAHKFSAQTLGEKPNELSGRLNVAIIIAQAMDYDLIRTVPSALSGTATGLGYSQDAVVLLSLAQYIRNLGYQAVAGMNDTSLAIPLAIKAGMGEYGRLGLLITPEFGPRVRLGKIFTDMPLAQDRPVRFGVKEFCEICRLCSTACPVKAISESAPSMERHNRSNIKGIRKWSVNAEKCFGYWAAQNSDCSICIRVCPYNKDFSKWWHRLWRSLAKTGLRRLMLNLHVKLGYGQRLKPAHWWQKPAVKK